MKKTAVVVTLLTLAGCAGMTPTREQVEGYKIYDIKTAYSPALTQQLAANIKQAMQKNSKGVQFNNELPPATLPATAARFELVNPFKNSPGLMALTGGNLPKLPQCDGAVIQATSHDSFAGAENTTFFVCLMPYQQGYGMNIYYTFTKVSGGVSTAALGQALAESISGDSSQFIPRTIAALEDAVKASKVSPAVVESYPN